MNNLLTEKAQACFEAGNRLQEQGNFAESIQSYQQAIHIQPDYTQPLFKLAEIYESQKNWSEAIKHYQRLIISEPDNYAPYLKFARTLQRQNHLLRKSGKSKSRDDKIKINNHKSIVAYQKAFAINPEQPVWVYIALGDALNQSDQLDAAICAYQKGVEINPDNSQVCIKLAKALMDQKQVPKAIALYRKAIASQPKQPAQVYIDLSLAFSKDRQFNQALAACYTAIELDPESNSVFNPWANIYKKLYFQQNQTAISLNKKLAQKFKPIVKVYHQAIKLHPDQAQGYFGIAHILLAWQNWDKAIEFLIEALKRNPNWNQIYTSLAYALKMQGDEDSDNIKLCYEKSLVPQTILNKIYQLQNQDIATANELKCLEVETVEPSLEAKIEKTFVVTLTNGRAWRNLVNNSLPNNAVITSSKKLVQEVSTAHNAPLIFCANNYTQPLKLDETVAYLQGIGSSNYYHWMLQVIPQLCLLRQVGIDLESIEKFAFLRLPIRQAFEKETLSLLGIDNSKILETAGHPLIQAKKLIVTSPIKVSPPRKLACDLVRDEFLPHKLSESEARSGFLYLSCQNATKRKIVNESKLIELLASYGFTSLCLESIPFLEQVDLFSKAKVIIAPHGVSLTNLIFCNPGVKVIEIFAPSYSIMCYKAICDYYHLQHYSLIAEGVENLEGRNRDKNINVQLDSLIDLMKLADIM
ncbi:tetratricopeptide repeat protein [Pleurocapsa sp. FMAR1]|uniref:tetratricopeptide repeat protein n=1 Tax=Pleurocapsa sp. FMAR1 TaxID=3040204 RepID=UPI0029C7ED79|nr:tetratricopeptide repeat protein [Pleurocapsa sp. FMAR1]